MKKKASWKVIVAIVGVLGLVATVLAAIFNTSKNDYVTND